MLYYVYQIEFRQFEIQNFSFKIYNQREKIEKNILRYVFIYFLDAAIL